MVNLYLRLLRVLFKVPFCRRIEVLEPARIQFRSWPNDCDLNFHLNNGRYLTFMDLGRFYLLGQLRLLWPVFRRRWLPVIAAAEISFVRPLKPLRRFTLSTQLLSWDEKYFYIEQRFSVAGRLHAMALIKGLFLEGRNPVDPARILEVIGVTMPPPAMPEMVRHWDGLSGLKREHAQS